MLSDERILRLLNDAHQTQAWHDGDAPKVHESVTRSAGSARGGWKLRVGVYVTVAACVAIALTLMMVPPSGSSSGGLVAQVRDRIERILNGPPGPTIFVASTPQFSVAPAISDTPATADPESVLMAIVQDDAGDVRCVRWSCADFDGRALNELKENELRTAGLAMLCQERPSRLVVVAMQGPKQSMPTSDSHATHLAKCIMAAPACEAGSISMRDCTGGSCVGSDVQVRVEAVAMR